MKIQDLTPPVAVPEPAWKQQLVEFWQQADDHHKIDLEVTLKMGDAAGARRIIESWQQEVIERRKKKSRPAKKKKSRVRYGYGGYWTPGFNFGGTELGGEGGGDGGGGGESVREASTPDGVSPSTKMFLEQDAGSVADVIQDFVGYCVSELGIEQAPQLQLRRDPAWSQRNRSFGRFDPQTNRLDISTADRHIMDVLRTVAHELVHHHQQEQQDLPPDAGETGSKYENEANARAGELMRSYGRSHPELFGTDDIDEGWKQRLGGAALAAACAAGTSGCATTGQLAQGAQIAARTAQTMQGRNIKDIARAELEQELKNYARAQRGDANAQNLSRIYQAQRRQQQNESSGYIPTTRERNDPRFKMALSPDVQPGATGKNANKMALKTGPQGEPQLLIKGLKNALREFKETGALNVATPTPAEIAKKHGVALKQIQQQLAKGIKIEQEHTTDAKLAREIALDHLNELPDYYTRLSKVEPVNEDQDLFEIDMSPSNLRKLVRDIDARAGIEFEMIVPGVRVEDEDLEPDYDSDERVDSIEEAYDFFFDGDYNSRGDVNRLKASMESSYFEWRDEQLEDQWDREGLDYLRDYIDRDDLFDRDDHMEAAQEYVRELFADEDEPVDEQSDRFLDAVTERLDSMADEFVESEWEDRGRIYDDAREQFNEEMGDTYDESDWLRSENIRYMSDITNFYSSDVQWPYWRSSGGDGEMDIDRVANDFSEAIGRPVNAASSYHGARREAGTYVVEPDGSLVGDDSDDGGLEFVSPPLPLDELLSDMEKVREWAGQYGCYTNNSTGLHMNVSVPNTSTAKLDYVKLALLLGDEHVLNEFGRTSNTYAGSALKKIREILKNNPNAAAEVLNKMRDHMEALATKAIHSGETQKFTSINTKGDYVEFRSPGGDWLDANWDKVTPTLLRTVVALDAAMDPNKYRKEYQKKLYKLLDSSQQRLASPNVNKLLSMYFTADSEGGSREVARQLAKELLVKRGLEKQVGQPGKLFWWDVWKNGRGVDGAGVQVVAATEEEALTKAAKEFGLASPEYMPRATAEVIKPYVETPASAAGGKKWGLWITELGKFATRNNERLEFDSREAARDWYADQAMMRPGIRSDVEVREISAEPAPSPADQALQRAAYSDARYNSGDLTPQGDAPWAIYNRRTGEFLRVIDSTTATAAEQEARRALGFRAENPEDYVVRSRAATPAAAGPAPAPGQPQQQFSGEWKIVDASGQELHRFGGVGNVQADANRVALSWLRQNPRHMQDGVEVVPVMSE